MVTWVWWWDGHLGMVVGWLPGYGGGVVTWVWWQGGHLGMVVCMLFVPLYVTMLCVPQLNNSDPCVALGPMCGCFRSRYHCVRVRQTYANGI